MNSFQFYKKGVLPGLILTLGTFFSAIIGSTIQAITENTGFVYYQYPSASVFVGISLYLISEKWWKFKPFIYLFDIPMIEGRYEGFITYQHPITGVCESKRCAVEVFQSGSKVKVNSYFQKQDGSEKTPSLSLVETIVKRTDGTFDVVFNYLNQGKTDEFTPHHGTNTFKVIKNDEGQFLKGTYYTSRIPQTTGDIDVKLVSQKLKNDY